jgi:ABC-2 type transport system ATP-binding protein
MIRVRGISKCFGATRALKDVSFSVEAGELVGFLGPNGAGKTTTLRILSSFLVADQGSAEMAGFDIRSAREQACSRIGYMPERAPLHEDMRVTEFLSFRARLKGVPRADLANRLESVLEQLELGPVRRRLIARLSRGFRQRVALADALIADPKVLLLDEPTSGLDPLQRRAFRDLLVALSKDRSVLFSSHVLPEVEAVASRFLVLSKGRLVGDGDLPSLRKSAGLSAEASAEDIFSKLVAGEEE